MVGYGPHTLLQADHAHDRVLKHGHNIILVLHSRESAENVISLAPSGWIQTDTELLHSTVFWDRAVSKS